VAVAGAVLLLITGALHKEFVTVGLDRETARAVGLPIFWLDLALYAMVTVAIVISIQAVGNILVLALLITPAACARLLTDRIGVMMLVAPLIGAFSGLTGLYLSYAFNLAAGGLIVLTATAVFVACWVFAPRHGLLSRPRRTSAAAVVSVQP
jgi:manganese/iron transport system permease protein